MQPLPVTSPRPPRQRALGLALALGAAMLAASGIAAGAAPDATTIRVGPFAGDQHLADMVAETLLTDLAKSDRFTLLDARAAGAHADVGKADYALTGSCLGHNANVVINVRVLESAGGRTVPGLAQSVEGPRTQLLTLAHGIAARLAPKLAAHAHPQAAPAAHAVVTASVHPAEQARPAPADRADEYTGLIVDARGLGLERSMSPSLRRKDGSVVWNGAEAQPDYVIDEGIVQYAATMEQALKHARAGAHPLVLTAVGRRETPFPSDPLLSDEDAARLLAAAKHDAFLKKFRVVFVTGK